MHIGTGKFRAHLNTIQSLLKELGLLEERILYPNKDFDPAEYRARSYIENWLALIRGNIYDMLLIDNSMFSFKHAGSKISYTFLESPYNCLSYDEYLIDKGIEEKNENTLSDYYESYLQTCVPKEHPVMIRYDFDIRSYNAGVHPISHIHIGNNNQVRIGIHRILAPTAFVHFVLRQHYTPYWKKLLHAKGEWLESYKKEKHSLEIVHNDYWCDIDYAELHF